VTEPGPGAAESSFGRQTPRDLLTQAWALMSVPLAAIVLALLIGAVVIVGSSVLVTGRFDLALPIEAYASLFSGAFGSFNGIVSTLVRAAPLTLGGLAVGIAFKAGLFNIGAQGQFLIGALSAAWIGAALAGAPVPVAIAAALLAGGIGGALYGFMPGFLKAWTGAHEVVTTIMFNYIAIYLIAYLISGPLLLPGAGFARTGPVGNAGLPILLGRDLHLGVVIAFLFVPAAYWLLWRSTLGFEIRTVGANPNAARYAGMRSRLLVVLTMSLCGMLAGLAGGGEILGTVGFMGAGYGTSVGFDSISVALLGRAHPVGILLAALLFGAMRAGAGLMQINAGIPVEIVDVLQGVILLFLAADLIVRRLFRLRAARVGVQEVQTITRSYGEQAAR
jgi:general nucleoside transport system permease protein